MKAQVALYAAVSYSANYYARRGFPTLLVFSQLPKCLDQAIENRKAFYISFIK